MSIILYSNCVINGPWERSRSVPDKPTPYEALAMQVGARRGLVHAAYRKGWEQLEAAVYGYAQDVGRLVVARAVLRPEPDQRETRPLPERTALIPREVAVDSMAAILDHEQQQRWHLADADYLRAVRARGTRLQRMLPFLPVSSEGSPIVALTSDDRMLSMRGLDDIENPRTPEAGMRYVADRSISTEAGDVLWLESPMVEWVVGGMLCGQLIVEGAVVATSYDSLGGATA